MVYEKEDLLIDGPGKYHDYNFYRVAGVADRRQGQGRGGERVAAGGRPRSCCREPVTTARIFYLAAAVALLGTRRGRHAPPRWCTRCSTWSCRCSRWR